MNTPSTRGWTWPTIIATTAAKVQHAFENQTRTTAVATIAKTRGGEKFRVKDSEGFDITAWQFPDGSVLYTSGRGASHQIWTE